MAFARASEPKSKEISWIKVLTSRALVVLERSCDSLARRQGCVETWTLGGREDMMSSLVLVVAVMVLFSIIDEVRVGMVLVCYDSGGRCGVVEMLMLPMVCLNDKELKRGIQKSSRIGRTRGNLTEVTYHLSDRQLTD